VNRLTNIVLDTNAYGIFGSKNWMKNYQEGVNNCDSIDMPQSFEKESKILPLHLLSKPLKELEKGRRKKGLMTNHYQAILRRY